MSEETLSLGIFIIRLSESSKTIHIFLLLMEPKNKKFYTSKSYNKILGVRSWDVQALHSILHVDITLIYTNVRHKGLWINSIMTNEDVRGIRI